MTERPEVFPVEPRSASGGTPRNEPALAANDNLAGGGAGPMVRVRGLRAPQAAPVRHCRHCGVSLVGDAARASGFCCAGCACVFRLVHERGLDGYYNIRDAVVAPVDPAVFQPRDFGWLAALQAAAENSPATPELEIEVQGISCAGCVWLIERLFHQQAGALQIETNAQLGRMRWRWREGKFDAPAFARLLHSFNYLVGPAGEEPSVSETKPLVRRIGLCAAFAMNVMLFTLPAYFGMTDDFASARLFRLLAMIFATFSVLTGGVYFLNRAFHALRRGMMHIDLPIAVGITGAYAGSLYGWIGGREELVYFDFVAAFILLMLTGRWAQTAAVERNRRRLLKNHARPRKVFVETPLGPKETAVEELKIGDLYGAESGQTIPVSSRLESPAATFDTSWINGEADARTCRAGAYVPSGAVSLGRDRIKLRAGEVWKSSLLAQLLRPGKRDEYRQVFLERIVRGYLIGIFAVALLSGLAWWLITRDAAHTGAIVIAVLVVSCPCAIGLAFPLTDELATLALRRHGVFVREGDVWPRLARVRKIIFDKTGTLTLETPALRNPETLAGLSREARDVLFSLVNNNPHPVSRVLCEHLLGAGLVSSATVVAGEVREEAGYGMTLAAGNTLWSLGRPGWRGVTTGSFGPEGNPDTDGSDVEFARDGIRLAGFGFKDALRTGARAEIEALRSAGFATYILSGDRTAKVNAVAEAVGIAQGNIMAKATPAGKAAWVRGVDRRDTLMLGDGANDSLAFDEALVRGTPVVHRGLLEDKSDFYLVGRGLGGLRELFSAADRRRHTQHWLLGFSILYNVSAVGLAAAGHMNPLLAAVLMPVSSLITLAITGLGMRETPGRSAEAGRALPA